MTVAPPRLIGRRAVAGFALAAFAVNDPGRAQKLYGWGVDSLIGGCSDRLAAAAGVP